MFLFSDWHSLLAGCSYLNLSMLFIFYTLCSYLNLSMLFIFYTLLLFFLTYILPFATQLARIGEPS